jgi:hypothetical protein
MPGPLLHLGATVLCLHSGQGTPLAPNPRVTLSGQPVVTIESPYAIAGCLLPPPPAANGPCVTGQFVVAALRVMVEGTPTLLLDSQGICAPTGVPLLPMSAQMRAIGT